MTGDGAESAWEGEEIICAWRRKRNGQDEIERVAMEGEIGKGATGGRQG